MGYGSQPRKSLAWATAGCIVLLLGPGVPPSVSGQGLSLDVRPTGASNALFRLLLQDSSPTNTYTLMSATSLTDNCWRDCNVYLGATSAVTLGDVGAPDVAREFFRARESSQEDFDGEGLVNIEEFRHGANPGNGDSDRDGLTDAEEVQGGLSLDPAHSGDAARMLEQARQTISAHWNLLYPTRLVFTNAPGSEADLRDLRNALMSLSGHFHTPVP